MKVCIIDEGKYYCYCSSLPSEYLNMNEEVIDAYLEGQSSVLESIVKDIEKGDIHINLEFVEKVKNIKIFILDKIKYIMYNRYSSKKK